MALTLFFIVVTLVVIAFAEPVGERTGIVAPVILLGVGCVVALVPQVPDVAVGPEIILQLILPPLLFATAMKMPQHDFRRNFSAIFVLAVFLVAATSLAVGAVIHAVVPEIPLAYAVAVGAVVSPSDAVAVGIVRRVGVNRRIISILDGEGLINDASALVLLSSALLAARGQVSPGGVALDFLWAVAGAAAIGYAAGRLFMALRSRLSDAPASTALSVAIPFAAYLPAELAGASGLVATVAAGLVVAHSSARLLHPATRVSDGRTWDTLGLILESLVFVLMGLQVSHLIDHAEATGFSLPAAAGVALVVWLTVLAVRAATVGALLAYLGSRTPRRLERMRRLEAAREMEDASPTVRSRVVRALADSAYHMGRPLGARAGGVIVWAGMRGAVTLAAAQTLPHDTPARGFLILVAFLVAAWSLVAQGATLRWVVEQLQPAPDVASSAEQRRRIRQMLADAARAVPVPDELAQCLAADGLTPRDIARVSLADMSRAVRASVGEGSPLVEQSQRYAVARVERQRRALVDARDTGIIDAADFDRHLAILDSRQLAIEATAREHRSSEAG